MTNETEKATDLPGRVRDLSLGPIAARASEIDTERRFPEKSIAELADVGALGLMASSESASLAALAESCEVIGSACASTGMVFLMHSIATATVAGGGGEQSEELLSRLADGALGTLAFSERGTGAHFYAPDITAERSGEAVSISGRKSFVTSGGHADIYLVLVASDSGEGADCYAIKRDAAGVSFSGEWDGLGMRGNSSIAMELKEVEVTEADRIGEAGAGGDLVFGVVAPNFLVGLAAVNVGIASAALATATDHITGRSYADGSGLAEVQSIQHALADMDMTVNTARLAVTEAARLGDAGDEGALVALMEAKVIATEAARAVTERALESCGGQAYTPALSIERNLRDARAGVVMAPTNGVLRNWIGKAIAGLPVP